MSRVAGTSCGRDDAVRVFSVGDDGCLTLQSNARCIALNGRGTRADISTALALGRRGRQQQLVTAETAQHALMPRDPAAMASEGKRAARSTSSADLAAIVAAARARATRSESAVGDAEARQSKSSADRTLPVRNVHAGGPCKKRWTCYCSSVPGKILFTRTDSLGEVAAALPGSNVSTARSVYGR